jgi:hypothetical protein
MKNYLLNTTATLAPVAEVGTRPQRETGKVATQRQTMAGGLVSGAAVAKGLPPAKTREAMTTLHRATDTLRSHRRF